MAIASNIFMAIASKTSEGPGNEFFLVLNSAYAFRFWRENTRKSIFNMADHGEGQGSFDSSVSSDSSSSISQFQQD